MVPRSVHIIWSTVGRPSLGGKLVTGSRCISPLVCAADGLCCTHENIGDLGHIRERKLVRTLPTGNMFHEASGVLPGVVTGMKKHHFHVNGFVALLPGRWRNTNGGSSMYSSSSTVTHACRVRRRVLGLAALAASIGAFSTPVPAASFVAYPGVYPIAVIEVRDAKTFYVNAAVWPGFERNFVITQPGIDIPSNAVRAPACEQKLAAKAKAFTESFFKGADSSEVRNIEMADTASENAVAVAYTERGSLVDALLEKGFARPSTTDPSTPWCTD